MRTAIGLIIAFMMVATGNAQAEQVTMDSTAQPPVEPKTASEMDQQAMMDKMKTLGSPSDAHKVLESLAGNWTYTAEFSMTPAGKTQTMGGTAVNTLIFDGRFLKQEIAGEMPEMGAFAGLGLLGYDNMRHEYQSVWLDNMMTGIMTGKGQFDAATNALTEEGQFSCPMTGETDRWYRAVWTVLDADHTRYQSFSRTPEGVEFKSMEILYTRAP